MASKKIGALWVRKTKDGMEYFSGVLDLLGEDINIAVFYNDKKEKDNQPDFNIVRSGQREESENNDNGGRKSYARGNQPATSGPADDEEIDIEDIPFD
jgi:uncharacterized protein (DUF736 family)